MVKYGNICLYHSTIVLPPIVPKCEESSYHNDPLFIHDIAAVFHAIKVRYFMDIFTYSHLGQKQFVTYDNSLPLPTLKKSYLL